MCCDEAAWLVFELDRDVFKLKWTTGIRKLFLEELDIDLAAAELER